VVPAARLALIRRIGRAVPTARLARFRCARACGAAWKWPLRALAVAKTRPQGPTGRVGAGL